MKLKSAFEIKGWDVAESDGIEETMGISRATIRKAFDGELHGHSVGYGLFLQTPEETGGYVVVERVAAVLADGREGTFVIQHYGVRDATGAGPWHGDVVPATGTGGFTDVTGTFKIKHEAGIAEFEWDIELPTEIKQ